jgi:putative polyhydroxyalkanoate system protein
MRSILRRTHATSESTPWIRSSRRRDHSLRLLYERPGRTYSGRSLFASADSGLDCRFPAAGPGVIRAKVSRISATRSSASHVSPATLVTAPFCRKIRTSRSSLVFVSSAGRHSPLVLMNVRIPGVPVAYHTSERCFSQLTLPEMLREVQVMWHHVIATQLLIAILNAGFVFFGPAMQSASAPAKPAGTRVLSEQPAIEPGLAVYITSAGAAPTPAGRARQIHIRRSHSLGLDGARNAACLMLEDLRIIHGIHVGGEWRGAVLHARGNGFDGTIRVSETDIEVMLQVSLLLAPLRKTIEREADVLLHRHLTRGE